MVWLSRLIAVVAGLTLIALCEVGLRLGGVGPSNDLFEAAGATYRINPHAARRFFPHQYARLAPGQDRFARDKDRNTFRVFALGASTLLGFPNPAQTSFPNYLQQMLEEAYPERTIEVVNCGITAINSFVLLDFIAEIVEHQPDLVLVYAGHNEFIGPYGAATPFVRLGGDGDFIRWQMALQRTAIYYALGEAIYRARSWLGGHGEAAPFGVHLVQREIYLGDEAHRRTEANFRRNVRQILAAARGRGVPLMLCTLVSNLEGFYPLRSQAPDPPQGSDPSSADYPRHAAVHFEEGLALLAAGDTARAQAALVRARDFDAIHLRACSPFNEIIRQVAAEPGAWLVDIEAAFVAAAGGGIIGDELISEYLHPTVAGHQLIAQTLLRAIVAREGQLGLSGGDLGRLSTWADYDRRLSYGRREAVLARNDLILLLRNMPYKERPPTLVRRLGELVAQQLQHLPKLNYAALADFARRGGFAFLAEVIAELGDPHLAGQLEALAGPLGFSPYSTSSSSP